MTDRELLDAAAKAAGMNVGGAQHGVWFYCEHGGSGSGIYKVSGNICEYWNALADDGDALRLAVKLRLDIRSDYGTVTAAGNGVWEEVDTVNRSSEEATRLAIVRAAAAMVKP